MNRSYSVFRWAGFGLMPLALGIKLPSFGVDLKLLLAALGLVAGFIAMRRMQRVEDGTTTRLRRIIVLSMLANGLALIEPWPSKLAWLAWISTAAGFAGPIAYLLLARAGMAIARSQRVASLERSWQRCVWIGLPLILSSSLLLLAWWVVSGFPNALHFESHSFFVMMGGTLVLSLPAVLLFHALFATEKAMDAGLGTRVRLLVRMFAHPRTADCCRSEMAFDEHVGCPWLPAFQLKGREHPVFWFRVRGRVPPRLHELSRQQVKRHRRVRSLAFRYSDLATRPSTTHADD